MDSRRPSLLARWWLPIGLLVVAAVLVVAKLSVRSVATGQPVLPGVAGAPVLGPAPTITPSPGPARIGLRVRVTDPGGNPVSQALVEVRDRFNTAFASQETGASGETLLAVPPNSAYVVTARKAGFSQGRVEGVEVSAQSFNVPAASSAPPPLATGVAGRLAQAKLVEVRLAAAEAAAPATNASAAPAAVARLLPRLYVGHTMPRVSLIDASSHLLLRHSDSLGQGRQTLLAPSADSRRIYAAWSGSPDVFTLDATELTVQRQTSLGGGGITSLAVNPQNGRLWVSTNTPDNSDAGILQELDPTSQQVLRRVPVGPAAFNLRFRPDGSTLYVPQRTSNSVSMVDPASASVTSTLKLAQWPTDYSVSPDGTTLYVANLGSDKLLEVELGSGQARRTLDIGAGANGVLAHPDGKRLFILSQLFGYVQVVDLASWQIVDLIPVGRAPQGLALSADARTLYVANAGSGSISLIDVETRAVKETLSTGGAPSSIVVVAG